MSFDWRTDEEGWDEAAPEPARAGRERPRRARSFFWQRVLLFTLFTALALAPVGYRLADVRVQRAATEAEAGVVAAHRLLVQGANRGDAELVGQLLARDARSWRRAQLAAISEHGLFGRPGLTLLQETQPTPEIVLAPDLRSAVVSVTLPYGIGALQQSGMAAAPIRLRQSLTYERRGTRWRVAQPEMGPWVTTERGRFALVYPEQEQVLAQRLAEDLSREAESMCAWLGGCPDDLRLVLHLFPYPALAVRQAYETETIFVSAGSPLALGQPLRDDDYQGLLDYYRLAFAEGLVEHLYRQQWPGAERYVTAVRNRLLVEVGLQRWTPSPLGEPSPAIPLPDQHILALCVEPRHRAATLYRHDLDSGRWTPLLRDDPLVSMLPLPDHAGVALQKKALDRRDPTPAAIIWRPGRPQLVLEGLTLLAVERHTGSPRLWATGRGNELVAVDLSNLAGCKGVDCDLPVTTVSGEPWDSAWDGHWGRYGHWRLSVDEGRLALRAIDGARLTIVPPMPGCAFATWVDE